MVEKGHLLVEETFLAAGFLAAAVLVADFFAAGLAAVFLAAAGLGLVAVLAAGFLSVALTAGFLAVVVAFFAGALVVVFLVAEAAGFLSAALAAGFLAGAAFLTTGFFSAALGGAFSLPAACCRVSTKDRCEGVRHTVLEALAETLTRPTRPLGRVKSPLSAPRLIALLKLVKLDWDDMSILYLSARYFLRVGREIPVRAS